MYIINIILVLLLLLLLSLLLLLYYYYYCYLVIIMIIVAIILLLLLLLLSLNLFVLIYVEWVRRKSCQYMSHRKMQHIARFANTETTRHFRAKTSLIHKSHVDTWDSVPDVIKISLENDQRHMQQDLNETNVTPGSYKYKTRSREITTDTPEKEVMAHPLHSLYT